MQAGDFSVAQAHTLDQVQAAADRGEAEALLLPVDSLFAGHPALTVSPAQEKKLRTGAVLVTAEACSGPYRVYGAGGDFLALCEARAGQLKTIKSFFEVDRE